MKKLFSLFLSFSILASVLFVNATYIEFEDLDIIEESNNETLEDKSLEEEVVLTESNTIMNEDDSSEATNNLSVEYIKEVEDTEIIPMENIDYIEAVKENPEVISIETFQPLNETIEEVPLKNMKIRKSPAKSSSLEVIDITDLETGPYANHNCVFNTKYNSTQHFEECLICGKQINKVNHTLQLVGNGPTCDVYVNLGNYVCKSNCGYSEPVKRLPHQRTGTPNWQEYPSIVSHIWYHCDNCGGFGSNSLLEYHTFNINGKIMNYMEIRNSGINLHTLGTKTCTICNLPHNFNYHYCYANTCNICNQTLGPTITFNIPQNITNDNFVMIDLANNNSQWIYFSINTKGWDARSIRYISLYGGNYTVGTPILVSKNGNTWLYKVEVSLTNKNLPITEQLVLNIRWGSNFVQGTNINGYPMINELDAEGSLIVYVANKAPIINQINSIAINSVADWATSCKITVSGTAKKMSTVYISMYYSDGTPVFEDSACNVTNNNFTFTATPSFEANEDDIFTFKVRDIFGNTAVTTKRLLHIDNIKPVMKNDTSFASGWSQNKDITIVAEDKGSGNVEIAFNEEENMQSSSQNGTLFTKTFQVTGDVYSSKKVAIYLKDSLGNIGTEYILIDKLDNTSPTITKVKSRRQGTRNATVTIEANDINTKLNASGSGIKGYALTQTNAIPSETEFQNSNSFNVSKSGKWYAYVIDNAGNITATPTAIDVKIEYTVSLNPNGGTLTGDSSYQVINGESVTIPNPTRTGYTFAGWSVSGEGTSISGTSLTMGSEDAEITAQWQINQYTVTYIDKTIDGKEISRITKQIDYNTPVSGEDIGHSDVENAYHNQYKYISSTDATVTTSGAVVYRIFEFCETEKESHLTWNDNNNADGLRPKKYTVKLKQNGKVIDEVELPSSQTDYTFENLPKYDTNGNLYKYEIETIVSDRYEIEIDSDGNPYIADYNESNFSILIPKRIVLDGRTGNADYNITVNGTFYYNDILIVKPDTSFMLTDKSFISSMQANVTQVKTGFSKEDLKPSSIASGHIQVNRTYFSGLWQGHFNFNIKFKMSN